MKHPTSLGASSPRVPHYHHEFDDLTAAVQASLAIALDRSKGALYRVDPGVDLFDVFLAALPPDDRQYHNCNCCRSFIHRFGALVTMDEVGRTDPALWMQPIHNVPSAYQRAFEAIAGRVRNGRILDQFIWDEDNWGTQEAGGFTHLWAKTPIEHLHTRRDLTADQLMAQRREDVRNLTRAINTMDGRALRRARDMLLAGELDRGEKMAPHADWLIKLQDSQVGAVHHAVGVKEVRRRLTWLAAASAPAGWCAPRSSALGKLVDDLADGKLSPVEVKRRHQDRVDPLKYQRPTAPPSAGNVLQAERVFAQLGIASALHRRHALADELVHEWKAKPFEKPLGSGLFGHLLPSVRAKEEAKLTASPVHITFARFRRDVLPRAMEMEALVPNHGGFCAYTTQSDPRARPILQWDSEECRNPFAWYVYHNGSSARQWGLAAGAWRAVKCVSLQPSMWGNEQGFKQFEASALFVLDGCRDTRAPLSIFPETLRSELHPVRATIEAHSRSSALEVVAAHRGQQQAAGLRVQDGTDLHVRVRTQAGVAMYIIDRWE